MTRLSGLTAGVLGCFCLVGLVAWRQLTTHAKDQDTDPLEVGSDYLAICESLLDQTLQPSDVLDFSLEVLHNLDLSHGDVLETGDRTIPVRYSGLPGQAQLVLVPSSIADDGAIVERSTIEMYGPMPRNSAIQELGGRTRLRVSYQFEDDAWAFCVVDVFISAHQTKELAAFLEGRGGLATIGMGLLIRRDGIFWQPVVLEVDTDSTSPTSPVWTSSIQEPETAEANEIPVEPLEAIKNILEAIREDE